MAIMMACLYITSDVSKEVEIVRVLARTEYVTNLMVTDYFLQI